MILATLVLSGFLGSLNSYADAPTYSCDIRNGSFVSSKIFEFDLYLSQSGPTAFELAGFNTGILLNAGFVNSGTITPSLLAGSELNASQVPTNIAYDAAFRCIKIAPKRPPRDYATGITSGTIISNTTGTKVCRVRLTNSADFGADPLNYSWSMNLMPYHTVVAAFVPPTSGPYVNTIVTNATSHSVPGNLTAYLEGLYSSGTGNRKAQDEVGDHFAGPVADLITVSLASATLPYATVYTTANVLLYANGKCSFSIPGTLSGSYYIVVNHRNSIETWSAAPVALTGGVNYNFTTAASQAYGNNMKPLAGGVFGFYGGNTSGSIDQKVDGTDMAVVDNGSTILLKGYVTADATGDGKVDGSDMALTDNNATSVITRIKP